MKRMERKIFSVFLAFVALLSSVILKSPSIAFAAESVSFERTDVS